MVFPLHKSHCVIGNESYSYNNSNLHSTLTYITCQQLKLIMDETDLQPSLPSAEAGKFEASN
jgi:hypothetical protein